MACCFGFSSTKARLVVTALVAFVVISFTAVMYVSIGTSLLSGAQPAIRSVDILRMSLNSSSSTANSLEANATLKLGFTVPKGVRVYPQGATFFFTPLLNRSGSALLPAVAEAPYTISDPEQHLMLSFVTPHFQQRDMQSRIWTKITGDFHMAVKLTTLPGFPMSQRHLYVLCHVWFAPHRLDKPVFKSCTTGPKPYK